MGDAGTILDRQTLYELVWSKPTAYLAEEYGISDVALGKMCQGMNVPKPPRGYWAKVRRGQKPPRPPLPPDSASTRTQVVIQPPKTRPPRPAPAPAGPHIPVPAQLHKAHPLIVRTAAALKQAHPRQGVLHPYGEGVLRIEVGESSRGRALLIMDTLVKELEQRGYDISTIRDGKRETIATVKGERMVLKLRERVRQLAHVMTADEKKQFEKYGREPYTKFDYHPSGQLRLSAGCPYFHSTVATWSDNARRQLEQQIGTVVVGLEAFAERLRVKRIEREETHRRWEEEARRREEEKRRREEETKRFEQLRQDAAHWREARLLRRYLRVLDATVSPEQQGSDFEKWLAWARERVEHLDPLKRFKL